MRPLIWASGALLLLFSTSTTYGDPPARGAKKEDSQGNWFTRLFSGKAKAPEPEPPPRSGKEEKAKKATAQAQILAARERYLERVKVCNKLRAVALQTSDDALDRQAEHLEARSWDAYQEQLRRFSGTSPEGVLDQNLGIDAARGRNEGNPSATRGSDRTTTPVAGRK